MDCLFFRKTCFSLKHSSLALRSVARNLLSNLGFNYVLQGKFQSDALEPRFGWYCQMCNGSYFFSIQVFQNEQNIKAIFLIKFLSFSLFNNYDNTALLTSVSKEDIKLFPEEFTQFSKSSISELNSIYYITGAMAHSQLRNKPCSFCSDILLSKTSAVETVDIDVFDCVLDNVSKFMSKN